MDLLIIFSSVIIITFLLFVAPLWIFFNYLSKTRSSKLLSKEDEKMLEDLWIMAKKMENRIATLETILHEEATPGRSK